MKLKVVQLKENDITEIDTIAKWFDGWYEWSKPYWSYKRIKRRLTTMTHKKRGQAVFVAKIGDKVVGTIGIARYDDTKKNAREYYPWIVNGFVLEEHRQKGIFKLLLQTADSFLISNKFNKVYIRTDWKNLYEKLGWQYMKDIVLDNGVKERLYKKNLQ